MTLHWPPVELQAKLNISGKNLIALQKFTGMNNFSAESPKVLCLHGLIDDGDSMTTITEAVISFVELYNEFVLQVCE